MQIENSDDFDSIPNPQIDYKGNYPAAQIEQVRAQLLQEIYENTDSYLSETRLNAKRKCGLFSREVINYFRHDIKPPDLKEICEEDTILKENGMAEENRLNRVIPNYSESIVRNYNESQGGRTDGQPTDGRTDRLGVLQ